MRQRPLLLAETPRAGAYGHRFILPSGSKIKSTQVENYLRNATRINQGEDYLAASRTVEQRLPNGAVRSGAETIMLANFSAGNLSEQRKNHLLELLQKRLSSLSELIESIDWDKEGKNTFVYRAELADWLNDEEIGKLPTALILEITPLHAIAAGVLLGLLTGVFLLFHF